MYVRMYVCTYMYIICMQPCYCYCMYLSVDRNSYAHSTPYVITYAYIWDEGTQNIYVATLDIVIVYISRRQEHAFNCTVCRSLELVDTPFLSCMSVYVAYTQTSVAHNYNIQRLTYVICQSVSLWENYMFLAAMVEWYQSMGNGHTCV